MSPGHRPPAHLDRPQRDAARPDHARRRSRRSRRRSTATTRRRRPATRCRRCGTGSTSCRCTGSRRSGRTATRSAAASCRRCRCRGACGPAAASTFHAAAARRRRDRAHLDASPTSRTRRAAPATLVFVAVRHEIARRRMRRPRSPRSTTSSIARRRGRATPRRRRSRRPPTPPGGATIVPDDVLLFRYSALTFNGHRIHYDRRYVTEVEGYPGLVVHGPLIATLLVDLLRRSVAAPLDAFRFRAIGRCSTGAVRRLRRAGSRRRGGLGAGFGRLRHDAGRGGVRSAGLSAAPRGERRRPGQACDCHVKGGRGYFVSGRAGGRERGP